MELTKKQLTEAIGEGTHKAIANWLIGLAIAILLISWGMTANHNYQCGKFGRYNKNSYFRVDITEHKNDTWRGYRDIDIWPTAESAISPMYPMTVVVTTKTGITQYKVDNESGVFVRVYARRNDDIKFHVKMDMSTTAEKQILFDDFTYPKDFKRF